MFRGFQKDRKTPAEWNKEEVTLVYKQGDKTDLNNYKGIAISSGMGKLFTRLLANRLAAEAEEKGWLQRRRRSVPIESDDGRPPNRETT